MSKVILLGAGASIQEGINLGLWDQIRDREKWSLNSIFKIMPYLPNRQMWVDIDFLDHNIDAMQDLHSKGVPLFSKRFGHHKKYAYLEHKNIITQYDTTREIDKYYGQDAIKKNLIYYGEMGLCGMFALSLAVAEGYTDIFLLGYDFGSQSLGNKMTHVYQENMAKLSIHSSGAGRPEVYRLPKGELRREIGNFQVYLKETNINIYNVGLESNIPYFPKLLWGEFFGKLSN